MDRRDFLKTCVAAGIGLGMASLPFGVASLGDGFALGGENPAPPDMVAVRNGEPEVMFDRGIAAMGGMGRFVKRGQKVAIKPNMSWDTTIEQAGNTNPALVNRIARHCFEAGASRVVVFDHSIEYWQNTQNNSGIAAAAREAGALVAPAEAERYYLKVPVNGVTLKEAQVHEAALDCDVLVSVPILKHHGGAGMTASMKNFMGAVWDRRFYHARGLNQCIADFLSLRKPDLNVIDAYRVLVANGPRSRSLKDVRLAKMQILSTDVVAGDAAGARVLGRKPEDFGHIKIAHSMGFGEIDAGKLRTRTISL